MPVTSVHASEEGVFSSRPAVLPSNSTPPESENHFIKVWGYISYCMCTSSWEINSTVCILSRVCYVPVYAVDAQLKKSTKPGLRSVYIVLCSWSPQWYSLFSIQLWTVLTFQASFSGFSCSSYMSETGPVSYFILVIFLEFVKSVLMQTYKCFVGLRLIYTMTVCVCVCLALVGTSVSSNVVTLASSKRWRASTRAAAAPY